MPGGRPTMTFHGKAGEFAAKLGVKNAALSISHTAEQAIAQVILEELEREAKAPAPCCATSRTLSTCFATLLDCRLPFIIMAVTLRRLLLLRLLHALKALKSRKRLYWRTRAHQFLRITAGTGADPPFLSRAFLSLRLSRDFDRAAGTGRWRSVRLPAEGAPRSRRHSHARGARLCMANAVVVLAVLEVVLHVPVALQVSWANFGRLTALYLAAAVPFFLTGLFFAVVFARETSRIPRLYGADLCGGAWPASPSSLC